MEKMNEKALKRIKEGPQASKEEKARKAPISYKSPGQLPRESEVKQLKIYVDKKESEEGEGVETMTKDDVQNFPL